MSSRNALRFVPLVVAAVVACDSATDPTNANILTSAQLEHSSAAACVAGVARVEVSVYPNSITPGVTARAYSSVYDGSGGSLPAGGIRWYIADTTFARISDSDEMGRPIISARANGTTQIVADCGSTSGLATLTISGASTPDTTTKPAGTLTVTMADSSLQPGQTTQAVAHTIDATGHPVELTNAAWVSSAGAVATVTPAGVVTAVGNGVATISATVSGAVAGASLTVETTVSTPTAPAPTPTDPSSVTATPPALPQSVPNFSSMPAEGRQIRVPAGGDLQAALDQAQLGDAILLAPGATFTGTFILRDKGGWGSCPAWITVRTDGTLPPQGTRVTPASAANLAKIFTADVQPALKTDPRASCYRIAGVEIALPTWLTKYNYGLVWLGDGGWVAAGEKQTSLDLVPTNIVLDRLYIHGQSDKNFTRCIALNSANTAIIDSWISDCHSSGNDSQAIAGWNGPGPYLIENNFISAAGENILFGGADPAIYNLVPSDITIRRNHFYKDPAWKGKWLVKNMFELKSARRTLVDGNVFENNWADGQTGMAIVIKSSNDGSTAPWQGTTDLTFTYNIVRNSPSALNIAASPEVEYTGPVVPVARVRAAHNVFENIGTYNGTEGRRLLILMNALTDVTIEHNTMMLNTPGLTLLSDVYPLGAARNIVINDNIATGNFDYAVFQGSQQVGSASLTAFAGSAWAFNRNVVTGVDPQFVAWHPQASWYPYAVSNVGFANVSGGDYRLTSGSAYKGRGLGGTDPGADIDELNRRTAGVRLSPQGSVLATRLFR